jgi:hypothetical protein
MESEFSDSLTECALRIFTAMTKFMKQFKRCKIKSKPETSVTRDFYQHYQEKYRIDHYATLMKKKKKKNLSAHTFKYQQPCSFSCEAPSYHAVETPWRSDRT